TVDTIIEQQAAMDEALVPHAQRLRIGRSNFRLLSDIKSKESTLQLVYDVLRICPFFKAFLVTTDVPEIYMQEFWVTATVHHYAIRFKMDNKKHIVNFESLRDMLHICPRVYGKSFDEPPFEEEILAFIHFLGHSAAIRMLTDVNINKLYHPWRSFAAIINKNSNAYKEYYAIAIGATQPKPKASVRRTRSSFDTSITPPTAAVSPRLTASVKGKQTAKASKAKSLSALSENSTDDEGADNEGKDGDDDEEDEGDNGEEGDSDDDDDEDDDGEEGDNDDANQEIKRDDDKDDEEEGGDDEHEFDEEEYAEESRDEESFDPIPRTPENSDDEGNGDEDRGLNIGGKEGYVEEEEEDELYRDTPTSVDPLPITAPTMTPSTIAIITTTSQAQILPTTVLSTIIQNLPNFGSLFHFDDRLRSLEANFSEPMQTNQFAGAVSAVNEQLEAEVLTRSSHSSKTSYAIAADLSELELKKIIIEKMKGKKSIQRFDEQRNLYKALVEAYESDKIILDTYREIVTLKRRRDDDADKDEELSAGPDRGSKRCRKGKEPELASAPTETATRSTGRSTQGSRSRQASASESALAEEPMQTTSQMEEPSHLEFDIGPTYELMKGSCKSLVELEYHLEEVFKATTDQLDWVNPEGQQYPHNMLKPLPLIPNNQGRHVIPFKHFINNDLKYLRGGASSCYDKHALWGVSHWGRKHQQFYGFAVNRESARDVYSKRRIIVVTKLKIVDWHSYKHLDWITVRRDDDKLYKFKEGDFIRLRIQDIDDMLLLLVQGKLTNLIVEERFAFNVYLRMLTRSIVIQRRVEDLQLGVKSYQKKLNLTKPDSYRSDLKRKEAYTAYSNPRGFIYQNKDKRNRLMWIDELHKFSDGTLIDVRTALDDRLKGIRMQYLPQLIWRKSDKDRATAMIHAIDKRLKTRRIMRILERFVRGRLYEGDFRMLQRTI
nr:hypothetical protein [Tanacetum cinerariifolium]